MRPYLEVQKLIWKDKMPSLNDSDAGTLAENFDFSGGAVHLLKISTFQGGRNRQCHPQGYNE